MKLKVKWQRYLSLFAGSWLTWCMMTSHGTWALVTLALAVVATDLLTIDWHEAIEELKGGWFDD